jgi:hypothetical protein
VTGGKPIAVLLQSISGVNAINPLVTFYDIHGGKREMLFFYFGRTPHEILILHNIYKQNCHKCILSTISLRNIFYTRRLLVLLKEPLSQRNTVD